MPKARRAPWSSTATRFSSPPCSSSNARPSAAHPRYPIGPFRKPASLTPDEIRAGIRVIADTPANLRRAVEGLDDAQLDTPYREGGWTVRQVVHHVPDSHLNSYVRFKLGLTEDNPTVKPYEEARWAETADNRLPIENSLRLLETLHARWVPLLESFRPEDWSRTLHHPEAGALRLDQLLALYVWHGPHHVAHVTELRKRNGW